MARTVVTVPLAQDDLAALAHRPEGTPASTYVLGLLREDALQPGRWSGGAVVVRRDEVIERLSISVPGDVIDIVRERVEPGIGVAGYVRALLRRAATRSDSSDSDCDGSYTSGAAGPTPDPTPPRSPSDAPVPPPPGWRDPTAPSVQPWVPTWTTMWSPAPAPAPPPDIKWVELPAPLTKTRLAELLDDQEARVVVAGSVVEASAAARTWVAPGETLRFVVGIDRQAGAPTCADVEQLDAVLGAVMATLYARTAQTRHRLVVQWRRIEAQEYGVGWHMGELIVARLG